ncbi:putative regulator of chromosome condensation 1/beta-lactamase-inhibitor protein II [Lupinus albus]|uniref:Putative regulator of chromosome condensation 1/beta-lactamase-inhibitor protein II n=1 Tax=Lupinus albus TaxID=3870 RepID=A0A6A4N3E9_LUPAL|nr:putative regulator of chromosome condensation 1/beta-lactamase-inhibitor protein II [Lupinus albus]
MKKPPSSAINLLLTVVILIAVFIFFFIPDATKSLGSGKTLAVTDASATLCGVVSGPLLHRIECYRGSQVIPVIPNVSFSIISGGRSFFSSIRSGNTSLFLCDTTNSNATFQRKRLYNNGSVPLENLAVGDSHVCATVANSGTVECWRISNTFELPSGYESCGCAGCVAVVCCGDGAVVWEV